MALKFHKVTVLPGTLEADSFYFVDNGTYAESYLTDSTGVAHSIGNTAMIQAIANSLIATALADISQVRLVADIAARDALDLDTNQIVLVNDASADATVDAGAALYFYDATGETWTKVAEYESMDVTLSWANIQNKPSSAVGLIDDAVTKRHEHTNKAQLDKIGESGGALTYDGNAVGASWTETAW